MFRRSVDHASEFTRGRAVHSHDGRVWYEGLECEDCPPEGEPAGVVTKINMERGIIEIDCSPEDE